MRRILCLRLDNWPIQRIRVERPELKAKPIVLHEIRRGSRRVAACSAEAKALGIVVGIPFAEAMALAGSTRLCAEAYDPADDREALEELAVSCGRFSPLVGLDDSPAPDSLLLDLTGLAHLFGGEAALAARIVHDFAQRGLAVDVAIADTLGAAWAAAHFGQRGKGKSGREDKGFKLKIGNWKLRIRKRQHRTNLQFAVLHFQFSIYHLPLPPSLSLPEQHPPSCGPCRWRRCVLRTTSRDFCIS
jgi:protein ImuB